MLVPYRPELGDDVVSSWRFPRCPQDPPLCMRWASSCTPGIGRQLLRLTTCMRNALRRQLRPTKFHAM